MKRRTPRPPCARPFREPAPEPEPAVALSPAAHLAALRLDDASPTRGVLYSWTTPEQVAALARSRVLLASTASSPGARSPFNRLLDQVALRRDEHGALSRLLLTDPVLEHRRYAWHAPYATVLGAGPRSYGTELLRIELRADAWIARFDPTREPPFVVTDLANLPVDAAVWQRAPRRIAAVYHLRTGPREPFRFREFILCSEPMVRRWSVGTAEITDELRAERAVLAWLAPFAAPPYASFARVAYRVWRQRPDDVPAQRQSALLRYQATLAFDNDRYRFRATNLDAMRRALDAYTVAATLDVRPP